MFAMPVKFPMYVYAQDSRMLAMIGVWPAVLMTKDNFVYSFISLANQAFLACFSLSYGLCVVTSCLPS